MRIALKGLQLLEVQLPESFIGPQQRFLIGLAEKASETEGPANPSINMAHGHAW
jgi:hypothetical protein